jgi:hypothetical protein
MYKNGEQYGITFIFLYTLFYSKVYIMKQV